jgi:hypothetical protein
MNTLSPQSSTSPSLGNATLHSGLETPRKLALPTTTREIELQYIVPEAIGSKLTKKHTPVHLTTHYFPKGSEVVEQIVKKSNLSGISDVLDIQNLNTVRLRQSIFSSGRNEYRLEFKGPKENCLQGGRIARPEFSFHIDQQLFATLLPEASAGLIVKLRYGIPGYIFKPEYPYSLNLIMY